nr:hypothetical protein [Tanacetum cinerariifolium]
NGRNQFREYAGQVAQNQHGYNAWKNDGSQVAYNAVQNAGVQSGGNQNGLVVVPGIANQSGTGNVVAVRTEERLKADNTVKSESDSYYLSDLSRQFINWTKIDIQLTQA